MTFTVYALADAAKMEVFVGLTSRLMPEHLLRLRHAPPASIRHWSWPDGRFEARTIRVFEDRLAAEDFLAAYLARLAESRRAWRILCEDLR